MEAYYYSTRAFLCRLFKSFYLGLVCTIKITPQESKTLRTTLFTRYNHYLRCMQKQSAENCEAQGVAPIEYHGYHYFGSVVMATVPDRF
ncbi:hypothetical protein BD408DRAFT_426865 [Parasitella parasitica]|nr:hypothetical protein BD408DRAFT_426865 [Parasitella parasitica]